MSINVRSFLYTHQYQNSPYITEHVAHIVHTSLLMSQADCTLLAVVPGRLSVSLSPQERHRCC